MWLSLYYFQHSLKAAKRERRQVKLQVGVGAQNYKIDDRDREYIVEIRQILS